MKLQIMKLHHDAIMPKYQTAGSVAFDVHAIENKSLMPGEVYLMGTGLVVEVPDGFELTVRPRSGMSIKFPNYIANGIGTIDCDYRGEIKIILVNNASGYMNIKKGDRIAQCVLSPITQAEIQEIFFLSETTRGTDGFGSTGT